MIDWIKNQVRKGNYQLKVHAIERASLRGIDPLDVKEALLNGRIIETYPSDARGESCLVYGTNQNGKDIHVVCGIAHDTLWETFENLDFQRSRSWNRSSYGLPVGYQSRRNLLHYCP